MTSSTHRWPGVPFALVAAVLFGVSTPIAKSLLGDVPPVALAGFLYLGSGVGLLAVRAGRRATGVVNEAPVRRGDLPWLLAVVLTGGVLGPVLLMTGLGHMAASASSLLLNLEGVFTLGIAWTVFRENVDLRIGLGAAAILAGAALLSWTGETGGINWGALAIAGACFAWAIDNNLTRKLSAADPVQIAMVKGLAAGLLNTTIGLRQATVWPQSSAVAAAMAVGFLGYGISLVCFISALRHLGTARTSAYFSVAPFAGAAVAVLWFGEPVTMAFLGAAGLMTAGLYLHLAERHEHEHVHDPVYHEHRHVHDAHHQHTHGPNDPPGEPHTHAHKHERLVHSHAHYPDIHHRHRHHRDRGA